MANETDKSFAKYQLGVKLNETKMLGLSLEQDKDLLAVKIISKIRNLTERTILRKLISIYGAFGIISSTTVIRKVIDSSIFDTKFSWDKTIPDWIVKK